MTTLEDLPSDILNLILSCTDEEFLVIEVWKCGSHRLNRTLSNGGCTVVKLEDVGWRTTSRWPKMLSQLRQLKSLSISRSLYRLMEGDELALEIQKLSPTLETLELTCYEAEQAFFKPLPTLAFLFEEDPIVTYDGTITNDLEGAKVESGNPSSLASSFSPSPSSSSRLWDISTSFPLLKHLKIEGECHDYFTAKDIESFPSTLQSLSFNMSHSLNERELKWPKGLTVLDLRRRMKEEASGQFEWNLSFMKNLPPNLIQLKGFSFINHKRADEDGNGDELMALLVSSLPRTLEEFPQGWREKTKFSQSFALALPPGIQYLSIANITSDFSSSSSSSSSSLAFWYHHLPKYLTRLDIDPAAGQMINIDRSVLSSLPRSLTHLSVQKLDWHTINQQEDFPPKLKIIKVDLVWGMTERDFKLLPETLTTASLGEGNRVFATSSYLSYLPRSLTELRTGNPLYEETNFPVPNLRRPSPTGGKVSISPSTTMATRTATSTSSSSSVSVAGDGGIPPLLRSLKLIGGSWLGTYSQHLPRNLTRLVIGLASKWTQEHVANLPRTITYLSIHKGSLNASELVHLPPHLTYFLITEIEGLITKDYINRMSRSLDYFFIHKSAHFEPSAISALPTSLKTLQLPLMTPLDPEVLTSLPPTLTSATLNFTSLADHHFALFPKSIYRLKISSQTDFTSAAFDLMPPKAQLLDLPGHLRKEFVNYSNRIRNIPIPTIDPYIFKTD
jgi:hypothetical protein